MLKMLPNFLIRLDGSVWLQALVSYFFCLLMMALLQFSPLRNSFLPDLDIATVDSSMKINSDVSELAELPGALHLIVDDETVRATGNPFVTDRSFIAHLIDVSRASQKSMVTFIDLNIDWSNSNRGDDLFLDSLRLWAGDEQAPLLVLVRNSSEVNSRFASSVGEIVRSARNIVFTTSKARVSSDGKVRNACLGGCNSGVAGDPDDISASLVIACAANAEIKIASWRETFGGTPETFSCKDPFKLWNSVSENLDDLATFKIRFNLSETRLVGAIPFEQYTKIGPSLINVPYSAIFTGEEQPTPEDLISLNRHAFGSPRIHIISSANSYSQDYHVTPFGRMSGPILTLNGARSLMGWGIPKRPPYLVQLILMAFQVLIIYISWISMRSLYQVFRRIESTRLVAELFLGPLSRKFWCTIISALCLIILYRHAYWVAHWDGIIASSYAAALFLSYGELRGFKKES